MAATTCANTECSCEVQNQGQYCGSTCEAHGPGGGHDHGCACGHADCS